MIKKILSELESEDKNKRLHALEKLLEEELSETVSDADRILIIKALKPHILDWDEDVRAKVSSALKLYTEQ